MIKLQHVSIIFIIIMLPLTMVLATYITTQIDTMNLQTAYTTKLNDATHDAIEAFQLNTRNNEYSTVADSLKRDVAASINAFFTSLAENVGMSGYAEQELQPYIPAIACTLYDGYYIYSPTKTNTSAEDVENVLKQYIYYTARYVGNNTNVVINYSLDSYISIYGIVNNSYVSRAGYLIQYGNNGLTNIDTGEGSFATTKTSGIKVYTPDNPFEDELGIKDGAIWKNKTQVSINSVTYNGKTLGVESDIVTKNDRNQYLKNSTDKSAIYYYIAALEFSRYMDEIGLNNAIGDANEIYINDIEYERDGASDVFINTNNTNDVISGLTNVFDFTQDPENLQSNFVNHKREIIKRSIEHNLQIAFNNYVGNSTYDYQLPKLTDEDWEKVYKNVSMISFMQGIQVGSKIFNDYSVVTSTGNEEYVNPEDLYFIESTTNTYHRLDCAQLPNDVLHTGYKGTTYVQQNKIIDETGKDILHDEDGTRKSSDHTSGYILYDIGGMPPLKACYQCIIESRGNTLYDNGGNLLRKFFIK